MIKLLLGENRKAGKHTLSALLTNLEKSTLTIEEIHEVIDLLIERGSDLYYVSNSFSKTPLLQALDLSQQEKFESIF